MDSPVITEVGNAKVERPEDKIAIWTALGHKERIRGVRWFASRPLAEQTRIIADGEALLPRLQQIHPETEDDEHLRFAAFVLAIRRSGFDLIRKRGYRVLGHKNFEQFESLRQGTLSSLKREKKAPLRQEVLALWGEVRGLRKQGNGFLLISRYLLRVHKLKVSVSYLVKLWREVET
jgi:hypothetical protein